MIKIKKMLSLLLTLILMVNSLPVYARQSYVTDSNHDAFIAQNFFENAFLLENPYVSELDNLIEHINELLENHQTDTDGMPIMDSDTITEDRTPPDKIITDDTYTEDADANTEDIILPDNDVDEPIDVVYAPERFGDYDFDKATGTITKYYGNEAVIVIPETIDEVTVTAIGDSAFYNNKSLTKVTFPPQVLKVNTLAFASCSNLMEVEIGNGEMEIPGYWQKCIPRLHRNRNHFIPYKPNDYR